MIGLLMSALVEAAAFERDLRLERAARALAEPGADREKIVISCQCWMAIVRWLEDDKFESFLGGEPTEGQDNPVVSWPGLEDAAARAIAGVKDDSEANRIRRARLTAIHAKLQRMRRDVDFINAEFRARREKAAA